MCRHTYNHARVLQQRIGLPAKVSELENEKNVCDSLRLYSTLLRS